MIPKPVDGTFTEIVAGLVLADTAEFVLDGVAVTPVSFPTRRLSMLIPLPDDPTISAVVPVGTAAYQICSPEMPADSSTALVAAMPPTVQLVETALPLLKRKTTMRSAEAVPMLTPVKVTDVVPVFCEAGLAVAVQVGGEAATAAVLRGLTRS